MRRKSISFRPATSFHLPTAKTTFEGDTLQVRLDLLNGAVLKLLTLRLVDLLTVEACLADVLFAVKHTVITMASMTKGNDLEDFRNIPLALVDRFEHWLEVDSHGTAEIAWQI